MTPFLTLLADGASRPARDGMTEPALQAQIDATNAYESLFVPALFRQWAPSVLDAARIQPGQRVLDVACGTGILVREAISRTGPDLRGWLPVMGVMLTEDQIVRILQEAEHVLGAHAAGQGEVTFDVAAHLVTATKA